MTFEGSPNKDEVRKLLSGFVQKGRIRRSFLPKIQFINKRRGEGVTLTDSRASGKEFQSQAGGSTRGPLVGMPP